MKRTNSLLGEFITRNIHGKIDETIDVHDGWPIDNSLEFIILVVLGV